MRRLVAVLILVGCDKSTTHKPAPAVAPTAAVPAPSPHSAVAPVVPPHDAGAAVAPPSTSDPAPPIPADVAAASPWIYRQFNTGLIVTKSTLTTWTLRRARNQAALTIETQTANTHMSEEVGTWSAKQTRTLIGSLETERTKTTLVLANGGETMTLVCSPSRISAAESTAVRRPSPRKAGGEDCGDEGRWVPMRMRSHSILSCKEIPPDNDRSTLELRFASAPGIEYLSVNDDCMMQGAGYRAIPNNGSVAPPRSSLP